MVASGWWADFPDPATFLRDLFHSQSPYHHLVDSAELDSLLDRAAAEPDPAVRSDLYRQAEEMLLYEIVPWVPLFSHDDQFFLAKPGVTGLPLGPMPIPLGTTVDINLAYELDRDW